MSSIFRFFIDNYKLTIIISLFLVIYGLMGLKKLNNESYPSVSFAMAIVETRYPGATPNDIETQITKPIEDEIRKVTGLKDVKSISQAGLSKIFVRADMDNFDGDQVLVDVEKAIERVKNLPSDIKDEPSFTELNSEEFPAIELAITGDNTNRERDLFADALKEELEDNKRVLGVRLVGFKKRQFNIILDSEKLRTFNIGIEQVLQSIQQRNTNIPGGRLEFVESSSLVRIEGKIENENQLKNIVIRSNYSGKKILLSDISKVEDSEEDITTHASYNGEPATLAIVTKKAGADTLALVADIESVLDKARKKAKEEFNITVYNNEASKVKNKLDVLISNAVSGLILVVVFLFIFLPGPIGLVASFSLPLAVMATLGMMPSYGMNLDAITILALVIALGMLVDNSVVISENFSRLKEEGIDSKKAALQSVSQLWLPITATAFTTIFAFIPMLITKGIMGQFIRFIPIVVTIALLLSLFESFFLLPMRLQFVGRFIKPKKERTKTPFFDRIIHSFEKFMLKLVRFRYIVSIFFVLSLVGSFILMFVMNKFILFPPDQTEIYLARTEVPIGYSLEKNGEMVRNLEKKIQNALGDWSRETVSRVGVSKGRPDDPKGKDGNNVGLVTIYASEEAKLNVNYQDFLQKLRTINVDEFESVSFEEMVNGPPVGEAINATFRSNDIESLNNFVQKIRNELSEIEGIRDLKTDQVIGEDEIFVDVDYSMISRLGFSISQIGQVVRAAIAGLPISDVVLNNKEVKLNIRFDQSQRKGIDDLNRVNITDPRGNLVPLSNLAKFRKGEGTPVAKRYDFKKSLTLIGSVDDVKMTAIVANQHLKKIFAKHSSNHPDVSLIFGGAEESTKESFESLLSALVLALIGIYAIMVFLFRSFLRPAIIMSTIPLGLIGFSVAFYLHQRPISFLAMIGLIGLAGIIVNSGIVLISFIDEMRESTDLPLNEILAKSSGLRLKAVVVTSLTTISGLLPTAYGIGGNEAMLIPMTLAMAWGLTSGTILTLVWIPCAYAILEDWLGLFKRKKTEIQVNSQSSQNNVQEKPL